MMRDKDWILDVTTLNDYVADSLAADPVLRSMRLRGEVSNFKAYPSGHWYFTLKDDRCRVSCVIFRTHAMRMSFRPADGDQVILHGSVRLYQEGGTYQFVADSMRPEGVGSLYRQFELLKAKLQREGLFDQERKRVLPVRPRKIAVVTSEAGAVLHDICRVAGRRDPGVPIVLVPTAVQGDGAAAQIAEAIERAGRLPLVDVLIVGRGGGSMEDLWAFNEEIVARAIAACPVPVISAVGHETDFTIADFVADVRASTPSNAAEMAVPDRSEVIAALRMMRRRFDQNAQQAYDRARLRLLAVQKQLESVRPDRQMQETLRRLSLDRARLDAAMERLLDSGMPRVAMASIRLDNAMDALLRRYEERLRRDRTRLEALSPMRVLERGFALVTDGSRVVSSAKDAPQIMTLHFSDGAVAVRREGEE